MLPSGIADEKRIIIDEKALLQVKERGLQMAIETFMDSLELYSRMLSGTNVRIISRGASCYTTGKLIVIPSMDILFRKNMTPEQLVETKEFLEATRGYCCHEVGHVRYTDFAACEDAARRHRGPLLKEFWNALEDPFVERKTQLDWPGTRIILRNLNEWSMRRLQAAWPKMTLLTQVLMGVCVIGKQGTKHWFPREVIGERERIILDAMGPEVARVRTIENSWETLALATDLLAKIEELIAPPPPKPPSKPKEESQDDEEPSDKGASEEGSDDSDGGEADPLDDSDEPDDAPGRPSDDEGAAGAGSGADSDRPDLGPDDGEDRGSDEAEPERAEDDPSDPDGSEDDALAEDSPGKGGSKAPAGPGSDDRGADGDSGAPMGPGASKADEDDRKDVDGSVSSGRGDSPRDPVPDDLRREIEDGLRDPERAAKDADKADHHSMLADFAKDSAALASTDEYRVFTTEKDRIESPKIDPSWEPEYKRLLDGLQDHVTMARGQLGLLLKAKTQSYVVSGLPHGKLDRRRAAVALGGRPTNSVYAQTIEQKELKRVAVTLLVDQSTSMDCGASYGKTRMTLARDTAAIFAEALHSCQVPFEMIGFSTDGSGTATYDAATPEERQLYTRWCGAVLLTYKSFDEPWPKVCTRLQYMRTIGCNDDGEALRYAAKRLIAKKELDRRVLLVISDGDPSSHLWGGKSDFGGTAEEQKLNRATKMRHERRTCQLLKEEVEKISASGVEVVGLGMATDAVKRYYPKHVVVRDARDFDKVFVGTLKSILLGMQA